MFVKLISPPPSFRNHACRSRERQEGICPEVCSVPHCGERWKAQGWAQPVGSVWTQNRPGRGLLLYWCKQKQRWLPFEFFNMICINWVTMFYDCGINLHCVVYFCRHYLEWRDAYGVFGESQEIHSRNKDGLCWYQKEEWPNWHHCISEVCNFLTNPCISFFNSGILRNCSRN